MQTTNLLAELVLLQRSSHKSNWPISAPHLDHYYDAALMMMSLMLMMLVTNWMLCPKCPPSPLERMIGWVESMLKQLMPDEVNDNVNSKADQVLVNIEVDGKVNILRLILTVFAV